MKADAATTTAFTALSEETLAKLAVHAKRLLARASSLTALAPGGSSDGSAGTPGSATGTGPTANNDTVDKLVEALELGAGKKVNWDWNVVVMMKIKEIPALTIFTR